MNRLQVVEQFVKKQFLLSPDFFDSYGGDDKFILAFTEKDRPLVLTFDLINILKRSNSKVGEINWVEFEKARVLWEKGKENKIYHTFIDILSKRPVLENTQITNIKDEVAHELMARPETTKDASSNKNGSVIVTKNYEDEENKKKEVTHFVQYFRLRYNALKTILLTREELRDAISIGRLNPQAGREEISLIGMVQEKRKTKNGSYIIALEDLTGVVKLIINKENKDLFSLIEDVVLDDIIGVKGIFNGDVVYPRNIFFPDIPLSNNTKKSPDDVVAAFISDVHVGSSLFLEKQFLHFIQWLNSNECKASRVKYLFVIGDLVEGAGVFPGQEESLAILDVAEQYKALARYLDMIRKDIFIILCPGDHDAVRLSHPQPVLSEKWAPEIRDLGNVILVTNPSMVNIHATLDFPGFDVLLYHGHGFHYFYDNVESLRKSNALENPGKILTFLLQRRHLAPTHTATVYLPDTRSDPMVIDRIPDIFACGHLHRSAVGSYRNVITINCSCWQARTDFQIKVDNHPDPGKVIMVNLKSRDVEVIQF